MGDFLSSPEGVVECLYASISFAAGHKPNYNLMHALFHPQARITPPATDTGNILKSLTVEEFADYFDSRIQDILDIGGSEKQVGGRTEIFNKIAHVYSSYHFYVNNQEAPIARGVNSFQLVFENGRWWILSLTWDRVAEGEELPRWMGDCADLN